MTEKEILELLLEKVTKLDDTVAKLDDKVTKLDDTVAKLDDKVAKLDDTVAKLDDKVTKLEDGQNELKADVKYLKQMTKAIFDQTADLTEFRTETKQSLEKINEKIDNLSSDLALVEVVSAKNMGDIAKLKLIK